MYAYKFKKRHIRIVSEMTLEKLTLTLPGLGPNPFQGMSWWHSNGGMIKRTVRPCALSVKSTVLGRGNRVSTCAQLIKIKTAI